MIRFIFILIIVSVCHGFTPTWSRTYSTSLKMDFRSNNKVFKRMISTSVIAASMIFSPPIMNQIVHAKPEGVNRPDLLPPTQTPLIDTANFLAKGQEKKVIDKISELEKKQGIKLRVLCQAYPETPGLAIKDYWSVDDNTVVMVVDKGEGFNRKGIPSNIINLNIGKNVDLILGNQFWMRLTNKLGNQPYVKANGADIAILNAVEAITYCLDAKDCVDLPFEFNVLAN